MPAVTVGTVVAFYCACSASMLVLNKLAVHHIGAPAFVTIIQFVTTSAGVGLGWLAGALELDPVEWHRLRHFIIYVLAFSGGTWANMKVLQAANVETVIVFRSCAPLCVSILDYIFYGRAMPNRRSCLSLGMIAAGACAYVMIDRQLQAPASFQTYVWVGVWFSLLIFQLTYGKQLVTGLGLSSIWSPVLYTNSLAVGPTALIGAVSGDFAYLADFEWTAAAVLWLSLSCVAGIGISWAGFKCQAVITATAYTVVGVLNKLLTVLVNALMWEKHSSPAGICALLFCLLGGTLYQQSPLRKDAYLPLSSQDSLDHSRSKSGGS